MRSAPPQVLQPGSSPIFGNARASAVRTFVLENVKLGGHYCLCIVFPERPFFEPILIHRLPCLVSGSYSKHNYMAYVALKRKPFSICRATSRKGRFSSTYRRLISFLCRSQSSLEGYFALVCERFDTGSRTLSKRPYILQVWFPAAP
jgi:hypothetical protein